MEGNTCDIRDSCVYPGGSGRDRGDGGRVNVGGVGVGGDGLCWEGVGGLGVGGISLGGGWISAVTWCVEGAGVVGFEG